MQRPPDLHVLNACAGMFEDVAFQSRVAVDKRGRKLGKYKHKEDMRKYYRLQNEEASCAPLGSTLPVLVACLNVRFYAVQEDWGREIRPEGNGGAISLGEHSRAGAVPHHTHSIAFVSALQKMKMGRKRG